MGREKAKERLSETIARREAELLEHQSICDGLLDEYRFNLGDSAAVLERSKRAQEVEIALHRLERDLHLSTGMRIDEIDEQILARGADPIRADLLAVEETLSSENETIREKLEAIETSSAASDLQGDLLAVGGAIDREARRYAALTTAAGLLRSEVERYANAHQGPIIEAASEAFSIITEGRYDRIRAVGEEGDDLLLEAVAVDGTECGIDGLSDGTKDQLYLALRLATLGEYLKGAPVSLPVVIDDALVNFDDDRTAAAFVAFDKFSRSAQVIYFTHHEGAVAMAQRAIGERVDIVRLPPNSARVVAAVAPAKSQRSAEAA